MTAPAAQTGEETVREACYVYGVMAEPDTRAEVGELPAVGGDPETRVHFVRHDGVAAVVSELRGAGRPLGTPDDLRAHAEVLDTLAATGAPVLPFRFGTVLGGRQAVEEEMLAQGRDAFAAALDRLRGRAQFTVRAAYDEDAVLREVLTERSDIAELRESVAALPEDAGYYERVRLGELVANAVDAKRGEDAAEIDRLLTPLADGTVMSQPAAEDGVADASFLVSDARRAEFEQAAEDLARRWHGRVRLRLLGPLAPYDFVAEAMGDDRKEP